MRQLSESAGAPSAPTWRAHAAATAAVAVAATTASIPSGGGSDWYRRLAKPAWQPPSWLFGAVWTPLYASIAYAGGRALARADGARRRHYAFSLGVNLAVNASWSWLFFRFHRPWAAAASTLLLDISNADLVRRSARIDATAARVLVPYATWSLFATALSADIAVRNT
ncbi:TspO/MBR family protein [Kitasatospora terrestris]|uniref:Tryptophan-rich sensory protein n=1 Tax=Kitasatospora terrestris TaxID=258051 RepID=A0ABP9EJQ3_9ACTN